MKATPNFTGTDRSLKNSIDVLPFPRDATRTDGSLFGQVVAILQQANAPKQASELRCLDTEDAVSGSDHPRPSGAQLASAHRGATNCAISPRETSSWIVDSSQEISEKPADSPQAGIDGEMMAARRSIPHNHHPGILPIRASSRLAKHRRRTGLACARAFRGKNVGTAGVPPLHPLAKRGLLGQ
jgi:hypothetical protein